MSENQLQNSPYFSQVEQGHNQQIPENNQNNTDSQQQPMQIEQEQSQSPKQADREEDKLLDQQEQTCKSQLDKYLDQEEIKNQYGQVVYLKAKININQETKNVRIYKRENIREEESNFINYTIKFQNEFESSKPNTQLPSNIVRIYEWFKEQEIIYIVMEETGESLKAKIKNFFKDEPKKICVCKQIAEAVIFLHNNKIIHRSLKPDDFVEADQVFKLINFEFLRQNTNLRTTNTQIEINQYSAPELVFSNDRGNFSLDIWSLGVIFFEIFSGIELIDQEIQKTKKNNVNFGINELKKKISEKLSEIKVSAEIGKLLNQMLNWEPSQRPSISQVEEELQKLIMKEASKQETINYSYLVNSIISAPTQNDPDRRFHLLKVLGDGAEGGVFKAKVRFDSIYRDQEVAVKIQTKFKDNEKKFIDQLICDQQKNTGNYIIKIYEKFEWNGKQLLVMQLGQKDLYQYILDNLNMDQKEKQKICFEISKSIEYIHNLGLIHRDIKPENFLQINSIFKLIDFGLIKKKEINLRQTINIGTPLYQAPELAEGNDEYSFSVDIWSLGCIYYEIFSGKSLFDGQNQQQIKLQIMNHKLSQKEINEKINLLQVDEIWKTLMIKMTHPSADERIKINEIIQEMPKPEFQFPISQQQNNFQTFSKQPNVSFQQQQFKTFNQINNTPQKGNQQELEQKILIEFIKILETQGNQTKIQSSANWEKNKQKLISCIREIIEDQKSVFVTQSQFQQQQSPLINQQQQIINQQQQQTIINQQYQQPIITQQQQQPIINQQQLIQQRVNNFGVQNFSLNSNNQIGYQGFKNNQVPPQQSNFTLPQAGFQLNSNLRGNGQEQKTISVLQTDPVIQTSKQPNNFHQFQQNQIKPNNLILNGQAGFQNQGFTQLQSGQQNQKKQ